MSRKREILAVLLGLVIGMGPLLHLIYWGLIVGSFFLGHYWR